ncbi:MAG: DUF481 domain-containing protein [Proteobacteria bacterium]|nr:MAG: DUF481 domain-containing protein [Pseudomonadota bacterium]
MPVPMLKNLIASLWSGLACLCLFSSAAHADFTNDAELGVIVTNGNSKTQSLSVKDQSRYTWDKNVVQFNALGLRAENNDILSAKNWALALRYERELSSIFNAFAAQSAEGDRFNGIRQRFNSDLGAKYFIYKLEKNITWFAEAGYRFTKENSTAGLRNNFQKARLYTEAEKYWNPTVSTKLWAEYLPNFTVGEGWLFNAEASVSATLTSVFAVKSAYLLRYNNLPPVAAGKSDTGFTTSLVAKF